MPRSLYANWLRERAEWHGRMALYSVKLALKGPEYDPGVRAWLAGTSELDARYYADQAYELAREAAHFAALVPIEVVGRK